MSQSPPAGVDPAEHKLHKELAKNPRNLQALGGLAMLCMQRNQLHQAINLLQTAARIRESAPILANLGAAYNKIGRPDLALEVLARAVQLEPADGLGQFNYASVLMATGAYEKALQHLEQAAACPQVRVAGLAARATALQRLGQTSAAFAEISALLDTHENDPYVLRSYGNILLQQPESRQHIGRAIQLTRQAIDNRMIPAHELNSYFFLLGQLYQKQKDYDQAFAAFQQAHQRTPHRFNETNQNAVVETLCRAWSQIDRPPAAAATGKRRQIFIVGMPRSGTTLIEQILSMHPDSADLGECDLFKTLLEENVDRLGGPSGILSHSLAPAEAARLRSAYLQRAFLNRKPASVVTDKTLDNGYFLGQILQAFPDARVIWTRRDPRDTCVSIYTFDFVGGLDYRHDLGTLAREHNRYEQLMRFWQQRSPESIHVARYEDLIASPEQKIRDLVAFCGLAWDERYLDFHRSDRRVTTASHNQVTQPIYTSAIGRWRSYEKHLGPLLAELKSEA